MNPAVILSVLIGLAVEIGRDVVSARSRASEGGRKITGAEWRKITSDAGAALIVGLTTVFADDLDDDALALYTPARRG